MAPSGVVGPLRLDRRLPAVLRRSGPGDIVVIDQIDLDRSQAEALVRKGVSAVVNAAPSISGRYPNLGPEAIVEAGLVLVDLTDAVEADVFTAVREGATGRLVEGGLFVGDQRVAGGTELTAEEVRDRMDLARAGLSVQLQSLTHNVTEYLRREQDLLLHGRGLPTLRTPMAGRPVVVVVRAFDHAADLRRLQSFIREQKPVLVGVDGGADALLATRLTPDVLVVGSTGLAGGRGADEAPVSDRALRAAREVVLHEDTADPVRGADRLDRQGIPHARLSAAGTTEDIALLLADAHEAALVVTVGTHATLDEFLDRRRDGMASTFLTRLRLGPRLVDARSVPVLYAGRLKPWHLLLVLLVGVLALLTALTITPQGEQWRAAVGAEAGPVLTGLLDGIRDVWPDNLGGIDS